MNPIEYMQEMFDLARAGKAQGVYFYIAVYAFALCLYSVIQQIRTNAWPSTTGTLHEAGLSKFGANDWVKNDQEYVFRALYEYQVDGKEYQGTRVTPWGMVASAAVRGVLGWQSRWIERLGDGKVRVYYNPRNPGKSYLITPGIRSQLVTALIGCLPFVGYYWKFYA